VNYVADIFKLWVLCLQKKIQLCSGIDENAVGACAQLVFAPVDVAISDDVPLLPSGFRVIPLDSNVCVIHFSSNIFSTQLTTFQNRHGKQEIYNGNLRELMEVQNY
jgi:hypothetical protein